MRAFLPALSLLAISACFSLFFIAPAQAQNPSQVYIETEQSGSDSNCTYIDSKGQKQQADPAVCKMIYGCNIEGKMLPYGTKCKSVIDGQTYDADTVWAPVPHPKNKKVPVECLRGDEPITAGINKAVLDETDSAAYCRQIMVSDLENSAGCQPSQSGDPWRCRGFEKVLEKKKDPQKYWVEAREGAALDVASAAPMAGQTTGYTCKTFASEDKICVQQTQLKPTPSPKGSYHEDPTSPANYPMAEHHESEGQRMAKVIKNRQAGMPKYTGGTTGAAGEKPDTPYPENDNARPSGQRTLATFKSGRDCQRPGQKCDEFDAIRPIQFDAAYLNTPAYATYDPNAYPPGYEMKLADQLRGKTVDEVAAEKAFGNRLISESVAAAIPGGSQMQGIFKRLNAMSKYYSNTDKTLSRTAGEVLKSEDGLDYLTAYGPGANGLTSFLNGGGGTGKANFNSVIQGIFQQFGGGGGGAGGGGGGGGGNNCTPGMFGNFDQCLNNLMLPPQGGVAASTAGCPPQVLTCASQASGGVTPSVLQQCFNQLINQNCSSSGGGGGGNNQLLNALQGLLQNIGSFGSMQQMKSALAEPVKMDKLHSPSSNSTQMFSGNGFFANFHEQDIYPIRPEYSECANYNRSKCTISRMNASYNRNHSTWGPTSPPLSAVRLAGQLDKNIRVRLKQSRYDFVNTQLAMRIAYCRWCDHDRDEGKQRCTPGHECANKDCPCPVNCWSSKCWGVAIDDNSNYPSALVWNASNNDPARRPNIGCPGSNKPMGPDGGRYFNSGKVTGMLLDEGVQAVFTAYNMQPFHIHTVAQHAAKPMRSTNKTCLADARHLDQKKQPMGEGYAFWNYHGPDFPHPELSTTADELGGQGNGRVNLDSYEGALAVVDTSCLNSYGNKHDWGYGVQAMHQPNPIMDRMIDFGFNDRELGFVKDVLAGVAGAGGGGQHSDSQMCCLGGPGEATGGSLGEGNNAINVMTEVNLAQSNTKRHDCHACLPNFYRTASARGPMSFAANAGGGVVNVLLEDTEFSSGAADSGGGGSGEQAMLRSAVWPLACAGWPNDPKSANQFGFDYPMESGLEKVADMRRNAAGCFIYMEEGKSALKQPGGFGNVAVVRNAGEDDHGPYLDVDVTNYGRNADMCGTTDKNGMVSKLTFRLKEIPPDEKQAMEKAGVKRFDFVNGNPAGTIKVPKQLSFFCPHKDEDLGIQASAEPNDNTEVARNE